MGHREHILSSELFHSFAMVDGLLSFLYIHYLSFFDFYFCQKLKIPSEKKKGNKNIENWSVLVGPVFIHIERNHF